MADEDYTLVGFVALEQAERKGAPSQVTETGNGSERVKVEQGNQTGKNDQRDAETAEEQETETGKEEEQGEEDQAAEQASEKGQEKNQGRDKEGEMGTEKGKELPTVARTGAGTVVPSGLGQGGLPSTEAKESLGKQGGVKDDMSRGRLRSRGDPRHERVREESVGRQGANHVVEWIYTLEKPDDLHSFMAFITSLGEHIGNEVDCVEGKPQVTAWVQESGESMAQMVQRRLQATWQEKQGGTGSRGSDHGERRRREEQRERGK